MEVTSRRTGKGEDAHGGGSRGKSWGTQEVLRKCLFSSPKGPREHREGRSWQRERDREKEARGGEMGC